MPCRFVCLCLVLLAPLRAQQTQQQRDLKIEKDLRAAPKQTAAIIPRSYALVVGIAGYQDPKVPKLLYSERDAQSIFDVLISPEGGNFHRENVHLLIGPKATLANLRHELEEWLPGQAKDGDRVLIYFAGHGFLFKGLGYLAPYDIDISPGQIAVTGYPMDELGKTIGGKIRAKDKILLTDSCHSGAIHPEDTQDINHTLIELDKSLFSLTASRDREVSYEGESWGGGHGVFTYFVVRGLEGEADENGDGVVNADELQDYVRRNVREAASAARAGPQNPTVGQASFDPQMLLAYVPSRATPGAPPAAKEGSLIFVSNMDGVEVFLDGKSVGVVNKDKAASAAWPGARDPYHPRREDGLRTRRPAGRNRLSRPGYHRQHQDPDRAAPQSRGRRRAGKGLGVL